MEPQISTDFSDYIAALAASPDPAAAATKRVVIEFQAELGRMIRDRAVDERIREIMERYVAEDYVQHDPNAPGDSRELLIEFLRHVPLDGGAPPPVVSVLVEGELAGVMMRQPTPDPVIPGGVYDWHILSVFRVTKGKLSEHWGAFQKLAPGQAPM